MTHKYCIAEITTPNNDKEICILKDWEYDLIHSKCKVIYESNSKRELNKILKNDIVKQ